MTLAIGGRLDCAQFGKYASRIKRASELTGSLADTQLRIQIADDVDSSRRLLAPFGRLTQPAWLRGQQAFIDRNLSPSKDPTPAIEPFGVGATRIGVRAAQIGALLPQALQVARVLGRASALLRFGALVHPADELSFASGGVQVGRQFTAIATLSVERPVQPGELHARRKQLVAVRVLRRLHNIGFVQCARVLRAKLLKDRVFSNNDPVLMLAQAPRVARIKPTEVEEAQRFTINQITALSFTERTGRQIPIGNVVARVAEADEIREQAGYQVDPSLIDEEPLFRIVYAITQQTLRPPVEQRLRLLSTSQTDKAKIECAGDQNVDLRWRAVVARNLSRQVRSQDETAVRERLLNLNHPAVDADVRIEICDATAAVVALKHVAQEPRLHRRREFSYVVRRTHLTEVLNRKILGSDDGERLIAVIDQTLLIVDHKHDAFAAAMMRPERFAENARVR